MSPLSQRVLRGTAVTAAVAVAYGGGVLTGVVGSHKPAPSAAPQGVIDEAEARIAAQAASPVDPTTLERAAVEGMLRALGDKWSTYYQPSEYQSFADALEGRYTGVGLWLRPAADGSVEVGSVQSGSPAALAGVPGGATLLAVDSTPVAHSSVVAVAGLLRGPAGSRVTVQVKTADGQHTFAMTRTSFATDDVSVEHLKGSVTLLRIAVFTRGVGRAVREALASDQAAHSGGIILDLRGNPGGLLDEAVEVASAFLDGGTVVSYQKRGQPVQQLDALGKGNTKTPLVVLVDGGTASAAEVVAAAMQDRNRAVLVGSRTYGKGSVQEPTQLSDGSAIELTVGHYLTPAGRSIDGVGVDPDVLVPANSPETTAEQRAIEVLKGLLAALGTASGRG